MSLLYKVDEQVVQSLHKAMEVQSEVPDKDMVQAANALMEIELPSPDKDLVEGVDIPMEAEASHGPDKEGVWSPQSRSYSTQLVNFFP